MGNVLSKAAEYKFTCNVRSTAHFKLANSFLQRHTRLGMPVVGLSAFAATATFAKLVESTSIYIVLGTGALSILATVLSSLQTFLNLSDLSTKHHRAAVAYEAVLRKIDLFELKYDNRPDSPEAQTALEQIAEKLNQTVAAAPTIPYALYKKTEQPETAAVRPRLIARIFC